MKNGLDEAKTTLWASICEPSSQARVTSVKSLSPFRSRKHDVTFCWKSFHFKQSFSSIFQFWKDDEEFQNEDNFPILDIVLQFWREKNKCLYIQCCKFTWPIACKTVIFLRKQGFCFLDAAVMLGWGRGAGSGSTGRSADSIAISLQLEGFLVL